MTVQHQEWKALRELLTSSLDEVESQLEMAGIPLPHQLEARPHEMDSPDFLPSKELHGARKLALASLGSLANLLKNPAERLMETCLADQRSAALALTTSTSIPTILSEAGPSGLGSKELSLKTSIQEEKLVKIMRYLSHNEIFNEVSERVFSHNRTSLYLMPNHPVRDFVAFAHWASINGTKVFQQTILNPEPEIRNSLGQLDTPTSVGLGLKDKGCGDVWDYMANFDRPRLAEFANSMGAYDYLGKAGELVDFPWKDLPPGSTLVDVGSGQGSLLLGILKAYPSLKGVAQDRAETIELAKKNFQANLPSAQVDFQAHDFFDPQPTRGEGHVYILRNILHDWCDQDCSLILDRIRDAMLSNDSRLLIVDALIEPCRVLDPETDYKFSLKAFKHGFSNDEERENAGDVVPYPLRQSCGLANEFNMVLDLMMMSFLGAKDRTLSDFNHLFAMSGLEILKIWKTRGRHAVIEVKIKG